MDIYPVEIDGDPELLKTEVSGDWIYREGVSDELMVRSLEAILQQTLDRRIVLQFRQVERDVVVARGRFHSSPLAGRSKNHVEIYGKQILANGGGAGGGAGKFPEFLKWVGEWIERPVVDEVEDAPRESIQWSQNARCPFTEHDAARGSRRELGAPTPRGTDRFDLHAENEKRSASCSSSGRNDRDRPASRCHFKGLPSIRVRSGATPGRNGSRQSSR